MNHRVLKIPCFCDGPMKGISWPVKTAAKWNFMVFVDFPWKLKYFISWAMNFIKKRHSWAKIFLPVCSLNSCLFSSCEFGQVPILQSMSPTLCKKCVALLFPLWVAGVEVKETRPSGFGFGFGFEPMTFCQAVLSSYLLRQPGGGLTNDSLGGRISWQTIWTGWKQKNNSHATHNCK